MKNKIIALVFELEQEKTNLSVDSAIISEVLSFLRIVYDEVFIWSAEHHLAVWVVGKDASFLAQTFATHCNTYEYSSLQEGMSGMSAQQLFRKIAEGKIWADIGTAKKLQTLQSGFEISNNDNCLGPCLFPFVTGCISFLKANSIIYASRNSWTYAVSKKNVSTRTPVVNIKSKDTFYRFCVN